MKPFFKINHFTSEAELCKQAAHTATPPPPTHYRRKINIWLPRNDDFGLKSGKQSMWRRSFPSSPLFSDGN